MTISAINRIAATDPQFGWRDCAKLNFPSFVRDYANSDTRLFGYEATLANGLPIFVTMSKLDQIQESINGGIRISPRQEEGVPQVAGQFAPGDVTDPAPTPAKAPQPAPVVSSSLGDILTRLNARAADGLKVTVEPYLAPKRATVFGEALATPRQELDAVADVYGLRVLTEEKEGGKDRLRLTRRTTPVPLDVVAMHASILQALPGPLVRACHMHPAFVPFDPAASVAPISPIPSGLSPLLVYAVRQIRTAAEPRIKASKDGHVALSALSEQEGRAFAVTLIVDAMESLSALMTAELPKEVTRFSDLRLSGGLYEKDGKKKMDFMLTLPNPNDPSQLQPGMGVGDINYDPVNGTL